MKALSISAARNLLIASLLAGSLGPVKESGALKSQCDQVTTFELDKCIASEIKALDAEIRSVLAEIEVENPELSAPLDSSQEAWRGYRSEFCHVYEVLFSDSTMGSMTIGVEAA